MWVPETADDLLRAIDTATLPHEPAWLDVKQQLPAPKANQDIAVDVTAMATDGGVIIYGVAEDKRAMTFTARPLDLTGVKERISDVVNACVRERVEFDVRLLTLGQPNQGFVVIVVPASPRAPHMVETKGQFRYYGRSPGGNVILTEQQVAQLYTRRRTFEALGDQALDAAQRLAPLDPAPGVRGDLHLVARPQLSDGGVRARAGLNDNHMALRNAVLYAAQSWPFPRPCSPNFADIVEGRFQLTPDGVGLLNPSIERDNPHAGTCVSRLEVLNDGSARYFQAALAQPNPVNQQYIVRDTAIPQLAAHFIFMVGRLLHDGGYRGTVDLILAVVGAEGAVSVEWLHGTRVPTPDGMAHAVPENMFVERLSAPAARLNDEPLPLASSLCERLLRVVRPAGFPDPLAR